LRHETLAIDVQAGHFAQFHAAAGFVGAIAIHGFAADALIGERRAAEAAYEGDPSHGQSLPQGLILTKPR
jgi:hypothetical protein